MPKFWPLSSDYADAVQMPDVCCSDPELKAAKVATLANGLPRPPCAGNFADVYQFRSQDGQKQWAVKCFTRRVAGLTERYREISRQLEAARLPFTVAFKYLEQGMLIRGEWFPVLKMDWVEGLTLRQFVEQNLQKPKMLNLLYQIWLKVEPLLRQAGVAHGDLQYGNVMLVAGSSEGKLALRLIDYDGMWVPSLAGQHPGEVGHPCFQHPQRAKKNVYSPAIDRFPHLVIACALNCLGRKEGPALWKKFDNGDNLLFRPSDFESPAESSVLHELWETGDAELQAWSAHLAIASQVPLTETLGTESLCLDGRIQPLTADVEHRLRQVLDVAPKRKQVRPAWMIEDAVESIAADGRAIVDREGTISDNTADEEWMTNYYADTKEVALKWEQLLNEEPPPKKPTNRLRAYFMWGTLGLVAASILPSFIVGSPVLFLLVAIVAFVAGIGCLVSLGVGFWLRWREAENERFKSKYTSLVEKAGAILMAICGSSFLLVVFSFVWALVNPPAQSRTVKARPLPASNQNPQGAFSIGFGPEQIGVMTAESGGSVWRYTEGNPGEDWNNENFDDKNWGVGRSGFGTDTGGFPYGLKTATDWKAPEIWLRTAVNLPDSIKNSRITWRFYHDDEIEIYVNGQLLLRRINYITEYATSTEEPGRSLLHRGTNVIAVHCRNTGLASGVDVGFTWQEAQ